MKKLLINKRARFDYEILDTLEAGIVLHGFEVKSLKKGHGSLKGAYVIIQDDGAFVTEMHISPYQPKNTPDNYDPHRKRKLLLNKKEIVTILRAEREKGIAIIPIEIYTKNSKIKVKIALAQGKKKYDKRESIKKREDERDIGRKLKG